MDLPACQPACLSVLNLSSLIPLCLSLSLSLPPGACSISNLSQVRARDLQDLVYKQGQGGVTKATVSIVFNNADTKGSPIGYEHCDLITVTRQVS